MMYSDENKTKDEKFHESEVDAMADLLYRKYGYQSFKVANIFENDHKKYGDIVRADVWNKVTKKVANMILDGEINSEFKYQN